MNKKLKIAGSILAGVALLGGAYSAGHLMANPEPLPAVEKIVNVTVEKEVPGPTVFVDKEVKVEVPVEDESFKKMACARLHYDILSECVEEVNAEDAALKLAVVAIKEDYANELEDADIVAKEKYAELTKVFDKFEDVEVTGSDFDNEDYTFEIKATVKDTHEEEKVKVLFTVDVQNGEAEIKDVELI